MSKAVNLDLRQQWYDSVMARDLDSAMSLLSPDFVTHAPVSLPGAAGVRAFFEMQWAAFPDHKVTTMQVLADDEFVAHYMRSEGTQQGPFLFLPPSGKYITWTFIDIFRVRDGKFVEHWVESDRFGMMQQLGIVPPAPQG
jgi:predicted ester cyclase